MKRVSISLRDAKALLRLVETAPISMSALDAGRSLRRAIASAESPKHHKVKRANVATKAAKRLSKKERRAEVRAEVAARAKGRCEACFVIFNPWNQGELDHYEGRARSESVETCWMLCRHCHRMRTLNQPSAATWHRAFLAHCKRHAYFGAAEKARALLAKQEAKAQLVGVLR